MDLGVVGDTLDETIAAVRRARELDADILVTTGGASVGEYDFVQAAFAAEGMTLSFWKVAMRPGRPLMHGRLGAMHVLGLPGNRSPPMSAPFCSWCRSVRRLSGRGDLGAAGRIGRARLRPRRKRRACRLSARELNDWRRRPGGDAVPDSGQFHDDAAGQGRLSRHPRTLCARGKSRQPLRDR